ncbi:ABC transporter permease [Bartonella sp. JB15]|nr:macrolide transport system ATP-binding/permease protein [Bartonella sp. JB15]
MNDADIILADEPTGALDRKSGQEVLHILDELHQERRTIIIVTHDMKVAERADRIIEISDGKIISDSMPKTKKTSSKGEFLQKEDDLKNTQQLGIFRAFMGRFREAFVMALLAMNAHRMRTFLTMLGVIIGISSVVAMVALGNGTQKRILENLKSFGTNTLTILPGKSFSDPQSGKISSLVETDAEALSELPYVAGVTSQISTSSMVYYDAIETKAVVVGVGEQFFRIQGLKIIKGRFFDQSSVRDRAVDLIIEKEALAVLFPNSQENPIGKIVRVGNVPARIIGVLDSQDHGGVSDTIKIYLPYTAVQTRFLGRADVRAIILKVVDNVDSQLAETMIRRLLIMRHGKEDFFIRNSESFRKKIMESTAILTILVTSIAAISLFVGGIGVMNIMLVTVAERINEIGVRMAIGARQSDILQQFLIEAVLICVIGGSLGVFFGFIIGGLFVLGNSPIEFIYTSRSIVIAVLFSAFIGVCFGFFPARKASRLDPVVALARD